MCVKSNVKLRFISIVFVNLFVVALILARDDALALQRQGKAVVTTVSSTCGKVVVRQQVCYKTVCMSGRRHFSHGEFSDGRRPVGSNALAFQRHGRAIVTSVPYSYGTAFVRLPCGYKKLWAGGRRYFYCGGVFYRRRPFGFIVTKAPVGAVVVCLPVGCIEVPIRGSTYYYLNGAYYQRVPSGYAVVEVPRFVGNRW